MWITSNVELFSRISCMYFHPYAAFPSIQNVSRMSEIFVCREISPRRLTCESEGKGVNEGEGYCVGRAWADEPWGETYPPHVPRPRIT